MRQLISDFCTSLLSIINNESYVNIISMIVVALSSYKIAKFSASKPQKIQIKQLQLSKVYLPLFRLFSDIPDNPSKKQVLALHKKTANILDSNYELVFPQLHRLIARFKKEILLSKDYSKTISTIRHQVNTDYELLKKSLGYPSESILSIFARMTFSQKLNVVKIWLQGIILFVPMILICISVLFSQSIFAFILLAVFILLLLLFTFIVLAHITKHMDD